MTTAPPSPRRPGDDDDPTGVRALLSSLPDPGPMPEDLVARISAALDAESAARSVPEAPAPGPEQGPRLAHVLPLEGARRVTEGRRRSWWPAVAAAAGLLVVGGTGLVVVDQLHGRGTSASAHLDASSASSPGASNASAAAVPTGAPAVQIRLSGASVSGDRLAAYGTGLVSSTWTPATPHTVEQPGVGPIGTPQGVLECLSGLGASPGEQVAAEIARFGGRPAVILASRAGQTVTTYAVALPCTSGGGQVLGGPVTSSR